VSVEARAFVLRRNWILLVLSFVVLAVGVLVTRGPSAGWPFGALAVGLAGFLGPIFFLRNAFPRATPTTIRATETGLTLEGQPEVRSEDILEVKLLMRRGPDAVVELALRGGRAVSLRMRAHDAQALVGLLGARRARFRLMVSFSMRVLGSFALLTCFFFAVNSGNLEAWSRTLVGSLLFAVLLGWLLGFVRGRLVVGADGFTTRWLFRERFIAFRDVALVTTRTRFGASGIDDTIVHLVSKRRIRFRTVEAPNNEEERGRESHAMFTQLNVAFEKSKQLLARSVNIPSLVERGSRTAREWLSDLDALVRGGGSRYRVAPVSAEMLADLTSDPRATNESRVGAAAALVRMGDDAQRTRVRIVAEGCAASELRDTLLALAEARDDASAEAALASLRR
jgi:hypothetical protein